MIKLIGKNKDYALKFCLSKPMHTLFLFREEEKQGRLFVWQGYTGKVELISFKTFLTKHVRRVALGGEHSLFLTYDDFLYSCGSNEHGELGVPSFTGEYSFDPCLVESLTGKSIWFIHDP